MVGLGVLRLSLHGNTVQLTVYWWRKSPRLSEVVDLLGKAEIFGEFRYVENLIFAVFLPKTGLIAVSVEMAGAIDSAN